MSYKVHRFDVSRSIDEIALERFLNGLRGKVVSITPNMTPTMHFMGATAGCDYLVIVERLD